MFCSKRVFCELDDVEFYLAKIVVRQYSCWSSSNSICRKHHVGWVTCRCETDCHRVSSRVRRRRVRLPCHRCFWLKYNAEIEINCENVTLSSLCNRPPEPEPALAKKLRKSDKVKYCCYPVPARLTTRSPGLGSSGSVTPWSRAQLADDHKQKGVS
jgi:hypothetical protein